MTRGWIAALVLMVLLPSVRGDAQQSAGGVIVTPTTVTRVTLIDVKPGRRPDFDQDMMTNGIPIYEEQKKAGLLTEYRIFNNVTTDSADDWNVGIALTYPSYAVLDTFGARTAEITLKHYGSVEKRRAALDRRVEFSTVVSSRLTRNIRYSRGT